MKRLLLHRFSSTEYTDEKHIENGKWVDYKDGNFSINMGNRIYMIMVRFSGGKDGYGRCCYTIIDNDLKDIPESLRWSLEGCIDVCKKDYEKFLEDQN